ncbi:MAG: extracellular solute-binding protein [Clostridia bacterium]|nr:extracellular solute-binding protein [Clostridia bacterium]
MKRVCSLILALLMLICPLTLTACSPVDNDVIYLNVYNWEDYIAQDDEADLIKEFEDYYFETYGKKVKVNYSTFGTNENMYNELQLSKVKTDSGEYDYGYDLVCPSDYMIQKMIYEDMVEPLDYTIAEGKEGSLYNYEKYVSRFIYNLFENQWDIDGKEINWNEYSIPYMFGTMGFVYNPDRLAESGNYVEGDESHWDFPWQTYSKNLGTIKDSIRDTYALAMGKVYGNELKSLRASYEGGEIDVNEYQRRLVETFNRVDEETVEKVTNELIDLKYNVYGFEVDSGKRDMASSKIAINFAWSGDAVYTMDIADEAGTTLYYAVPEEGSNIWFDGWVMPKGANKTVAQEFMNFLACPENAIKNMNFIGYTPTVAGEEMFANCVDWYGTYVLLECDEETEDAVMLNGKYYIDAYFGDLIDENGDIIEPNPTFTRNADGTYNILYPEYNEKGKIIKSYSEENVEMMLYDVSIVLNTIEDYENGNVYAVWTESENANRQLFTQYPSEDVVNRCAIMRHLSDSDMKMLNDMWDEVKVSAIPTWLMWLIIGVILAIIIIVPLFTYLNKKGVRFNLKIKNKNLTLVKREIIK